MDTSPHPTPRLLAAAGAFRHFFRELREAFLEREALFTQLELALLAREHVLVIGPPGTGKSAVAGAVLGRIVDARTGAPSLFSRQLTETTVQTDLVGPVDFKVLTETGRTEHLTDEGMLGAAHAFLDEVFDGRDMLLRALLNALNERELKHGRKVTQGRTACAVMTSNRYLSEVVARSPELLVAFADRLSFVCFVPRAFARPQSRAAMLERALHGQRPQLRAPLTLQELEVLQAAVEQVRVPGVVLEGLELLAGRMERALAAWAQRVPDYVPTRSFSQRGLVKALWVLKAAVVRDCIWERPDRPLEATLADLAALGGFFATGGPAAEELEALLKGAQDARERSQLEGVRAEGRAFTEALAAVQQEVKGGAEREEAELQLAQERAQAEALLQAFQPGPAVAVLTSLRRKLVPGPRHATHRAALLSAARTALLAVQQVLGPRPPGEGREGAMLLEPMAAALALCDAVPELRERLAGLAGACGRLLLQLQERVALTAEAAELDAEVRLEALVGLAGQLTAELRDTAAVASRLALLAAEEASALRTQEAAVRRRVAEALRRRAVAAFPGGRERGDTLEGLTAAARTLGALEEALCALDPAQAGLRQVLLEPLARAAAQRALSDARFSRIEEYARVVQAVVEALHKEGLSPAPVLAECARIIEQRLLVHARALQRTADVRPPTPGGALAGEAYTAYRELLSRGAPDGELAALQLLEAQLATAPAAGVLSGALHEAVAHAELASLEARARYLQGWLELLLAALPTPAQLADRAEAERGLDRLVRSRFPLLAMREGELLRLSSALSAIAREGGTLAEGARRVQLQVRDVGERLATFSQRLLEARAAR